MNQELSPYGFELQVMGITIQKDKNYGIDNRNGWSDALIDQVAALEVANVQGEPQGLSPFLKTKEANPCRLEPVVMRS